jgi:hypothetical protein
MKKIILILLINLFCGSVQAEDSNYIFVGRDQYIDYFVDITSVTYIDPETISIHKIGQTTEAHQKITQIFLIDGIIEIDCKRKINRVVSIVGYDENANVVFEVLNAKNRLWENVQPGHGANTMKLACSQSN